LNELQVTVPSDQDAVTLWAFTVAAALEDMSRVTVAEVTTARRHAEVRLDPHLLAAWARGAVLETLRL
jgi:hypothetical protein